MGFLRDSCHGDVHKVVEYEWTQTLQYIYVQYTSDTVYRQPKLCHLCLTEVHWALIYLTEDWGTKSAAYYCMDTFLSDI